MKQELQDVRNQCQPGPDRKPDDPEVRYPRLEAEELEAVIAPGLRSLNHSETFLGGTVELEAEELEAVIAPKLSANHSETFLGATVELEAEELEAVIAPKLAANHSETFLM